jgi:hypothetical protein
MSTMVLLKSILGSLHGGQVLPDRSFRWVFFQASADPVENGLDRIRTSLLTCALFRLRTLT